jgi:tRNA-dihydrouridine synthase
MTALVSTPITVKIRLGWDDASINYIDAAKAAVDGGASAITLHARTRAQGYSGRADRDAFFRLAELMPVPVFASGDLFSAADALAILSGGGSRSPEFPGVSGVMFARGAMGDPFIFTRATAALQGEPEPLIPHSARLAAAKRHFELSLGFYDERLACMEFRKQACSYLKGMPGGAELRARVVKCSTAEDYKDFFRTWEVLLERMPGL